MGLSLLLMHSSEYSAFWRCVKAGAAYLVTQTIKVCCGSGIPPFSWIKGGGSTPGRRVQSCNRGQDFWPSKNDLDHLTMATFCPWPIDQWPIVCAQRLSHASWSPLIVPWTLLNHYLTNPPESALTVWLHFDHSRSSGHGAYGIDPPPPPPPPLVNTVSANEIMVALI